MKSKKEVFPRSPGQSKMATDKADDIIDRKIEAKIDILSASPRVNNDTIKAWVTSGDEDNQ